MKIALIIKYIDDNPDQFPVQRNYGICQIYSIVNSDIVIRLSSTHILFFKSTDPEYYPYHKNKRGVELLELNDIFHELPIELKKFLCFHLDLFS